MPLLAQRCQRVAPSPTGCPSTSAATSSPMGIAEVAAGDGASQPCSCRRLRRRRKSSTAVRPAGSPGRGCRRGRAAGRPASAPGITSGPRAGSRWRRRSRGARRVPCGRSGRRSATGPGTDEGGRVPQAEGALPVALAREAEHGVGTDGGAAVDHRAQGHAEERQRRVGDRVGEPLHEVVGDSSAPVPRTCGSPSPAAGRRRCARAPARSAPPAPPGSPSGRARCRRWRRRACRSSGRARRGRRRAPWSPARPPGTAAPSANRARGRSPRG